MKKSHYVTATLAMLLMGSQIVRPTLADAAGNMDEISAFGDPISDVALSSYRGGTALQINEMKLDGLLTNNQAISNVTGSNFVTESAFSGASGFSTVVQNSGNNVLIQNATILNLSLQ